MIFDRKNRFKNLGFVLAFVYVVFFISVNFCRFYLNYNIHDLYIFENSFWNTLHGRFFWNFYEFGNHLGVHFSPGLILVLPFYAIFQSPLTLLFLQCVFFTVSVFFIFKLAKILLKDDLTAFLISFAFMIHPVTVGAGFSGFHESLFAVPFFFLLFSAFERKNMKQFYIFAFAVLIWKETYAFILIFWALGMLLKKDSRDAGKKLGALSFLWVLWAFFIIMPLLRGVSVSGGLLKYRFSEEIGHSFIEIIVNFFKNPVFFFRYALMGPKIIYLLFLFSPLLFLPFLSPLYILPILPQLCQNLLSRQLFNVSLMKHYSIVMIPFIFYAFMKSISNLTGYTKDKWGWGRVKTQRIISSCILFSCCIGFFLSPVFKNVIKGERTGTEKYHYLEKAEISEAKRLGSLVPRKASFAVSGHLAKYFAKRKVISYVNRSFIKIFPFDYILYYAPSPEQDLFIRHRDCDMIIKKEYDLIEKSGRFRLWKRRDIPYNVEQEKILESIPD
jgi:uncharacterized membrane protein